MFGSKKDTRVARARKGMFGVLAPPALFYYGIQGGSRRMGKTKGQRIQSLGEPHACGGCASSCTPLWNTDYSLQAPVSRPNTCPNV